MIPLLYTARHRKQVLAENKQQAPSFNCIRMLFTPQERALIWSNVPAMTAKLMSDLDWALVALHIAAVTFDLPIFAVSDGHPSVPQLPREPLSDNSPSMSATHKKEGWVYHEDATSRIVKKQWFVCSCGSDGVYSLAWRNSESAVASSSSQSISFAKSTKTTVSQTKKNRAGWSHCCRIDHEHPLASAKKILSTKVVMCFNNEREMREWWSLIEAIVTHQAAPTAPLISNVEAAACKTDGSDPQSTNLILFYEDEAIQSENPSLSATFESIEFGDSSGGEHADGVQTGTSHQTASSNQNVSLHWLGFSACIDEACEFILRNVMCSVSLDLANSPSYCRDGTVRAIVAMEQSEPSSRDAQR
jgi:hypothetical protein